MVNIPKIGNVKKERSKNPILLYEVIRVIDGIPVFLEDHLQRLYHSAQLSGVYNLIGLEELEEKIKQLIADENKKIGNIRLSFTIADTIIQKQSELVFIPHFYPSEEKYQDGVKVGLLSTERPNPQAKMQNTAIRNKVNMLMKKNNVFEVLLVDQEGNITEGSRSNVFFVKDNQLITCQDEKVLLGITRKKILQLCDFNVIPVIKKVISVSEIGLFEGAFLTGSSPKVIPISNIGKVKYNPGLPLIKRIMDLYNRAIEEYLEVKKSSADNISLSK